MRRERDMEREREGFPNERIPSEREKERERKRDRDGSSASFSLTSSSEQAVQKKCSSGLHFPCGMSSFHERTFSFLKFQNSIYVYIYIHIHTCVYILFSTISKIQHILILLKKQIDIFSCCCWPNPM